jgi:APA family basic amino acid/polyamine antiporter
LILQQHGEGGGPSKTSPLQGDGLSSSPHHHHPHHYSLIDLISMGVGGTVGSGIFVLTGFISHHYAGPATFVSFLLSGSAALCSGLCFAEWSWRVPVEGSTYVYAFVALGEYAAVIAGACLTLEYGVSGAAVARSWGDKVLEWMRVELGMTEVAAMLGGNVDANGDAKEVFFNPLAGVISLLAVIVLACGVQESKQVTNFFTITKVLLVIFMIVGGFWFFEAENMTPLAPLGPSGVMRGATSSFFGYLGFDEICCLANEAKNPADLPRAVLWTLGIVTAIYVLASIALCGMENHEDISDTSGFPSAFAARGVEWAAQLTAAGEVFTLPVVVLISLLAQPRLFAAMAKDGLLPAIFARQTDDGNFFWGNILSGIPMTILATFVPFSWMDDAISVGILFAFNMTDTALLLMKCSRTAMVVSNNLQEDHRSDDEDERSIAVSDSVFFRQHEHRNVSFRAHILFYHILSFLAGLSSHFRNSTTIGKTTQIGSAVATLSYTLYLHCTFPSTGRFGDFPVPSKYDYDDNNNHGRRNDSSPNEQPFVVPLVPFVPLLGIFLNWYLIAQLDWSSILLLLIFLAGISAMYLCCINGSQKESLSENYHSAAYNQVSGHDTAEEPMIELKGVN